MQLLYHNNKILFHNNKRLWHDVSSYPTILDDGHHWWYDPTDLTQITKDSSNLVSAWHSKGVADRTLLQATGTNQPLWVSPGTIRFDGIDNFLKTAAFTWKQPCFVYIIVKQITWTINDQIFDGNANYVGMIRQVDTTPGLKAYAAAFSAQDDNLVLNTWGIIRVLFNGASSKFTIDNNTPNTGNFGASNMGGFTLGSRASGTNFWSNIEVADIICADQTDEANETEIYNWLVSRKPV